MTRSQRRDINETRRNLEKQYFDCYERYHCMYNKASQKLREVIFDNWYGGKEFKPINNCKDNDEIEIMINIMNMKLHTIRELL